jgi:hypothetical protein
MLLCLPTELWKNIAQMDAVAAIRLRTANKRLKAEIESWLCEWIYQRFVPNIVGLPWDLKPKYYVRLLCNYFCTDLHPFFVKEAVRDTVARLQKNVEYFSNKTNGVYWIFKTIGDLGDSPDHFNVLLREHLTKVFSLLVSSNPNEQSLIDDVQRILKYGFVIAGDSGRREQVTPGQACESRYAGPGSSRANPAGPHL